MSKRSPQIPPPTRHQALQDTHYCPQGGRSTNNLCSWRVELKTQENKRPPSPPLGTDKTARRSKRAHLISSPGNFITQTQPTHDRAVQRGLDIEYWSVIKPLKDSGEEEYIRDNYINSNITNLYPKNRLELPVIPYHKIMVMYPYPFLVVITQLFSWKIFIHECICILTGPPG